jgi:hypothetical protein
MARSVIPIEPSAQPKPSPEDSSVPVSAPHVDCALIKSTSALIPSSPVRIQSIEQISKIPEIVGVSLDILQQRARPAINGGETKRGFIKEKDSLLDVISKNWEQAEEAKITHAEIADLLRYLVETARKTPDQGIPYDALTSTNDPNTSAEKVPCFSVIISERDNPDTDIFRPKDAKEDFGTSNEEALITNTAVPGKRIRWTPIRERYIRDFGFYPVGMEFDTVLDVLYEANLKISDYIII